MEGGGRREQDGKGRSVSRRNLGRPGCPLRGRPRARRSAPPPWRKAGAGRSKREEAGEGGALGGYLWFSLIPRGNLKLSHSWHSSRLRRGPTLGLRAGPELPERRRHRRVHTSAAELSRAGLGRRV